jgi:hypothetical protein
LRCLAIWSRLWHVEALVCLELVVPLVVQSQALESPFNVLVDCVLPFHDDETVIDRGCKSQAKHVNLGFQTKPFKFHLEPFLLTQAL